MEGPVLAAIAAFVVVVLLVIVYLSIRVVQQYEKMVVFRLGRTNETMVRDPGLRFLVPIIDRPVKVDVREQFIEVPSQTTITKDNAPISVDFLIYWRISDPLKSVVNVANFPGALQGVATTTLRAVIGDILLDEVLSKREQINEVLRTKLDEVTERWGGKVTTVEIREITPPRDVQDAMNRQLSAERTRRAVITESEGSRQAAINVAEGQKQSEILKAEGERQAAILRAEGFSEALTRIFKAATGVDQKTMSLQYLEALKALGAGPATKFIIPMEFTRLLDPFREFLAPGSVERHGTRARGVIRRTLLAAGGVVVSIASLDVLTRRAARRLLDAPRVLPEEAALRPELDALGGEVVRIRARDGLRLSARWLEADADDAEWLPDPHEAIVLLHGWSGSIAPHLVEYGPFLRRTAGVLGLDFRGHGESDESVTTFGLREVDDVAGALSWLGERGVERVALVGLSMGGITAIASVAVLGDGSLSGPDVDPAAPAHVAAARRPRIVAVVADSVSPDLPTVAVPLIPGPAPRLIASRLFGAVARTLGDDPRATEPIRVIGLLEGTPLLLISGGADPIVGPAAARRLAAAAPPGTDHWVVPEAGHRLAHQVDPAEYETRVTRHLRAAFLDTREPDL